MPVGQVKWFNDMKGYGFIARDGEPDVLVHYSAIEAKGFRSLNKDELVEYEVAEGPRGCFAVRVRRLGRLLP